MLNKSIHIALVLMLGLYYNSVPIAWLSYSTFAEKIFAAHCLNPKNSGCNGKCQVIALENKTSKSGSQETLSLRLPQFHPPLPVSIISKSISPVGKKVNFVFEIRGIHPGILQAPFHPPRTSV